VPRRGPPCRGLLPVVSKEAAVFIRRALIRRREWPGRITNAKVAARVRLMADLEPLASVRRHLRWLAKEHDEVADSATARWGASPAP
jgi:hypothetical protein